LAKSMTQLSSESLEKLLALIAKTHPRFLGSVNSYTWNIDVGSLTDEAFRDLQEMVRRELGDDDVFGRRDIEREAAASMTFFSNNAPHSPEADPKVEADDWSPDAAGDQPRRKLLNGPLILRDKDKDKNFEFGGIPCVLKSMQMSTKRPWVCAFGNCTKAFLSKDRIVRHSLTHSGVQPFVCETCRKRFNDKANLNHHRKTKHPVTVA